MTTDDKPFNGFSDPTQNWSRLPHQLIGALPLISSLGEMKVILYVLRHTWGYHDDDKRISTDEFCNGRKHSFRYKQKHPDESDRLDNGTGMSKSAILRGIERAIEHGFLEVEVDDSDKGRIKKYYRLIQADDLHPGVSKRDMSQTNTPRATKQDITAPESIHQSKKETIERNLEKEPPPAALSLPDTEPDNPNLPLSFMDGLPKDIQDMTEDQQRSLLNGHTYQEIVTDRAYWQAKGIETDPDLAHLDIDAQMEITAARKLAEQDADLDELWPDDRPPTKAVQPHSAEQVKAGVARATKTFEDNARNGNSRAGVADPTQDDNPWVDIAVREWCSIAGKDFTRMTKGTKLKLAGIFRQVGAICDSGAVPIGAAIKRFPGAHPFWRDKVGFEWPSDTFCNKLGMMLQPDVELSAYQPDSPPVLGPAETDWL